MAELVAGAGDHAAPSTFATSHEFGSGPRVAKSSMKRSSGAGLDGFEVAHRTLRRGGRGLGGDVEETGRALLHELGAIREEDRSGEIHADLARRLIADLGDLVQERDTRLEAARVSLIADARLRDDDQADVRTTGVGDVELSRAAPARAIVMPQGCEPTTMPFGSKLWARLLPDLETSVVDVREEDVLARRGRSRGRRWRRCDSPAARRCGRTRPAPGRRRRRGVRLRRVVPRAPSSRSARRVVGEAQERDGLPWTEVAS